MSTTSPCAADANNIPWSASYWLYWTVGTATLTFPATTQCLAEASMCRRRLEAEKLQWLKTAKHKYHTCKLHQPKERQAIFCIASCFRYVQISPWVDVCCDSREDEGKLAPRSPIFHHYSWSQLFCLPDYTAANFQVINDLTLTPCISTGRQYFQSFAFINPGRSAISRKRAYVLEIHCSNAIAA